MPRGGAREGAGRPEGVGNLMTSELRKKVNAEAIISFLEDVATGKLEKASLSERLNAATVLLKKVLPDCKSVNLHSESMDEMFSL